MNTNDVNPLESMIPDLAPPTINKRQQRFVEEYLKDFNGTQAAIRAGYARSGAAVQAARLLMNANIIKLVADGKATIARDNEITIASVINDLKRIRDAAFKAGQYGPAKGAVELMGKYVGMFVDKVEHKVEHGGSIELNEIARAARITAILNEAVKRKDFSIPNKKDGE